jgi:hypothetical protein
MPASMIHSQPSLVAIIIKIYGLSVDDHQIESILVTWFQKYDPAWITKALVETLYRGRYKLVSVDNILKDWQRIGKPRYNFTPEYEREILAKIPNISEPMTYGSAPVSTANASVAPASIQASDADSMAAEDRDVTLSIARPVTLTSEHLNPEESAPFHYHHHSVADAQKPTPPPTYLADTAAISTPDRNLKASRYYTSRVVPSSSGTLQGKAQAQYHRTESGQEIVRPAKRRLFNTLKAIVDPRNHDRIVAEDSVLQTPPPLNNKAIGHNSQF